MVFNRFRWVFCQLEVLRKCLPQNVRRVLQELPASLDGTYERILKDILKANPDQAYRMLQCLTVATRPLRVDELAEILALNFDDAKHGIPALNKDWRWDDERQCVLATCSSLIVVVDSFDHDLGKATRVVQFAHFSVKEFLTSDRLADITADISRFHIRLEPAHTVVAQACLAILLHLDHDDTVKSSSALSNYAARHWVDHAHFGNVSLLIEYGMRDLFDPAKPYFMAWLNSYDLDHEWVSFLRDGSHWPLISKFTLLGEDSAPLCLYYAALCGFHDLAKYLIAKYPQHLNATVGLNKSPLAAALLNKHIHIAELLHHHGAVLPIGYEGRTLLHAASDHGMVDVSQWLLNIGTDANVQDDSYSTPLHFAAVKGHLEIVQILLAHGVDVHARDQSQSTPLHLALSEGDAETAQLLIKHGADVCAQDLYQLTPLHLASSRGDAKTSQYLIKHGADVHARDQNQSTPLHLALFKGHAEITRLLIEHEADVHMRDQSQSMPLHLAWNAETAQLLIEHGADVHARDQNQSTPLHLAWSTETVQLLIAHGADIHARDQNQSTPLHLAWSVETAQLLIEHGADVHSRNLDQSTPLHLASSSLSVMNTETTVRLLIEHGASVNAYDKNHQTPLHRVSSCWSPIFDSLRLLLENGADVDAEDDKGSTPFQIASEGGHHEIAQLLLDHRASIVSNTM
jgi:ankyrin repeat protein